MLKSFTEDSKLTLQLICWVSICTILQWNLWNGYYSSSYRVQIIDGELMHSPWRKSSSVCRPQSWEKTDDPWWCDGTLSWSCPSRYLYCCCSSSSFYFYCCCCCCSCCWENCRDSRTLPVRGAICTWNSFTLAKIQITLIYILHQNINNIRITSFLQKITTFFSLAFHQFSL